MDKCPDCGVLPGQRHDESCDVARCSVHGRQWISCDACYDFDNNILVGHDGAQPTVWTGEWPGVAECRELNLYVWDFPGIPGRTEDLNTLAIMGHRGILVWNQETELWALPQSDTLET